MKFRNWMLISCFWIPAALILTGIITWVIVARSGMTVDLRDGGHLVLVSATFGTNHVHHYGKLFPRLVRPLLPNKLQHRLGLRTYPVETRTPAMVLWGHWSGLTNGSAPYEMRFVDANGVESEPVLGFPFPSANQEQEPEMAWKCLNYPRRDKYLHLRIYQSKANGKSQVCGELKILNPAPMLPPEWSAAALPVSVTKGPIKCTLVNFVPGPVVFPSFNPRMPRVAQGHLALFKITHSGTPAPGWQLTKLEVADALGNVMTPEQIQNILLGGYLLCSFPGSLWASEQAWKLRAQFIKTGPFEGSELWGMQNVAVPTNSSSVEVITNLSIQGAIITTLIIRRSSQFPEPGGFPRENAEVLVSVSELGSVIHLMMVQASDNQGNVVHFGHGAFGPSGWRFPMEIPPGTGTLNLQFAIQQPWAVEFITGFGTTQIP